MNVLPIIFIGIIICNLIVFGVLSLAPKAIKPITDEEFAEFKDYIKKYEQRHSSSGRKRNTTFPFN